MVMILSQISVFGIHATYYHLIATWFKNTYFYGMIFKCSLTGFLKGEIYGIIQRVNAGF